MNKAFTLIEFLLVIMFITIFSGMAIVFYHQYIPNAIKASLISDLRNCLTEIIATRQTDPNHPLSQIVSNCSKSKYTQEIRIESENPLILSASSIRGNVTCSYNDTSGSVFCEF